jgi:hypothetical protein
MTYRDRPKQPAARPPERPQKPRNPPHHHRGTPAGTPAKTQISTSSPPRHTRRNARKNPEIHLITTAAHPPERPQKARNRPHHRRGTPAGTPAKTQKSTSSPLWHTRRKARKNPEIDLITTAAHLPERPQNPRNPPHHHRGPSPTAKRGTSCAAAQLARPGRHNQCSASTGCGKRQLAIAKAWQERWHTGIDTPDCGEGDSCDITWSARPRPRLERCR